MLARRLLPAAGGSGGFAVPSLPFALTTAPAGGWTQIPEARAAYYNGVTYFTYVNGSTGALEIRSYTHSSGVTSSATVLHSGFSADSHNCPALLVRSSDHKIVVAYMAHSTGTIYVRISSSAEDISAFGSETTVLTGGVYTYPVLLERPGEAAGIVYLFHRNTTGGTTSVLSYIKSTDYGATWGTAHSVYSNSGHGTYWKIASDGTRIDFFPTDDNPSNATSRIYHFYADGTGYHKSDGTLINEGVDPLPFATSSLTLVYDSSDGPGWPTDAIFDGTNPRFVYSVDSGGTDSSFRYARWNGSAWDLSTIIASVGAGIVDPSPVACLDAVDVSRVYYCELVAGQFEMRRGTTGDNGMTWTASNLTTGSSVDNIYPTSVKSHPSGELGVLWLAGTYTADTSNSLGIIGLAA